MYLIIVIILLICFFIHSLAPPPLVLPDVQSHKKGLINNFYSELLKVLNLNLNLQFLNLFGFSISVSFVWCMYHLKNLDVSR